MRGLFSAVLFGTCIAGCGDPLADLDRISDVDLAEDSIGAGIVPTQAERDRKTVLDPVASPVPAAAGALFGASRPPPGDISIEARYGAAVPFGQVARVCEARNKPLGRQIEKSGPGGYALYDSDPGNTQPHSFYLTGFADGCPRQFTAALALLGAPSMHEQLRYGLPGDTHPYSSTDKAYETVKASVCNVRRGTPCGSAIRRLERSTVFVSFYERFANNARWADVLIHDGAVIAKAIKSAP